MRPYKVILIAVLVIGCAPATAKGPDAVVAMDSLRAQISVLTAAIDSERDSLLVRTHEADSLKRVVTEQEQMIFLTWKQAHKYATIVRKNPGQSVFIVGWIDRAFSWVREKSGK